MSLLAVFEELVLEREVEGDPVGDALACEPLVGPRDRRGTRRGRHPTSRATCRCRRARCRPSDGGAARASGSRWRAGSAGGSPSPASAAPPAWCGCRCARRWGGRDRARGDRPTPRPRHRWARRPCPRRRRPRRATHRLDVPLVAEVLAAGQVVALAECDRLPHHLAQCLGLVVDVTDLAQRGPPPRISTGRPRSRRTNMRCSRSGTMLRGPITIESADRRRGEARRRERFQQAVLAEQLVEPVLDLVLAAVDGRRLGDRQERGAA